VTKNGFYTTTNGIPHSGWTEGEAPIHFPKSKLHQKKVMITVLWSASGIIHCNFLIPVETITEDKYCQKIDKMHEELRRLHPTFVNRKGPILLHDVSQMTVQKLNELGYETLLHPAYSADLSPTDYNFFKHLENFLQEKLFKNQAAAQNALKRIHRFLDSRILNCWNKQTCFMLAKMRNCNGSYFD
jgi:histone-lysine N-methyltransferase SETMAR